MMWAWQTRTPDTRPGARPVLEATGEDQQHPHQGPTGAFPGGVRRQDSGADGGEDAMVRTDRLGLWVASPPAQLSLPL